MRQLESFFWGIVAALGALIFQLVLYIVFSGYGGISNQAVSFAQLFSLPVFIIIGAFIEESFKYLVISKCIDLFSQSRSYIINSILVGLGFFATELLLIKYSTDFLQIKSIAEIAVIHLGTAGLIGYFVAIKNPRKISTFLLTISIVTIFHAAYNLLILQRTPILDLGINLLLAILILSNFFNLIRIRAKLAQD